MSVTAASLHRKKVFSKINFVKGYHQVPILYLIANYIGKTSFTNLLGMFEYLYMPFGLSNIP